MARYKSIEENLKTKENELLAKEKELKEFERTLKEKEAKLNEMEKQFIEKENIITVTPRVETIKSKQKSHNLDIISNDSNFDLLRSEMAKNNSKNYGVLLTEQNEKVNINIDNFFSPISD